MADELGRHRAALRDTLQDYLKKDGAYRFEVVATIESEMIADPSRRDRLTTLRNTRESALSAHLSIVSQLGWPVTVPNAQTMERPQLAISPNLSFLTQERNIWPSPRRSEKEEGADRVIASVARAEETAIKAVRDFVETVNRTFADGDKDSSHRQQIIDSAFKMTEQLVGASNELAHRVVEAGHGAARECLGTNLQPERGLPARRPLQ